eukprot:gene19379-29850_t
MDHTLAATATFVGTVTYMSPERLEGKPYTKNVDTWGLGISVVELVTGRHPFGPVLGEEEQGSSDKFWKLINHFTSPLDVVTFYPGEAVSPACRDFMGKCLAKNPDARPLAEELLEHAWILENTSPNEAMDHATVAEFLDKRRREKSAKNAEAPGLSEEELLKALQRIAD